MTLDDEIERLQQQSTSQVENLDERLRQKNALIAEREATIDAARALLEARGEALMELSSQLRDTLWAIDSCRLHPRIGQRATRAQHTIRFPFLLRQQQQDPPRRPGGTGKDR